MTTDKIRVDELLREESTEEEAPRDRDAELLQEKEQRLQNIKKKLEQVCLREHYCS